MQHLLFLQAVSRRYVNLHNASYDWEREKGRERERERERKYSTGAVSGTDVLRVSG